LLRDPSPTQIMFEAAIALLLKRGCLFLPGIPYLILLTLLL